MKKELACSGELKKVQKNIATVYTEVYNKKILKK